MLRLHHRCVTWFWIVASVVGTSVRAQEASQGIAELAKEITPLLQCISGSRPSYSLQLKLSGPISNKQQDISLDLDRIDGQSFSLRVNHELAQVAVYRTGDQTSLVLPQHHVAFVGTGPVSGPDILEPETSVDHLLSPGSMIAASSVLLGAGPQFVASAIVQYGKLQYQPADRLWKSDKASLRAESSDLSDSDAACVLHFTYKNWTGTANLSFAPPSIDHPKVLTGYRVVKLDRVDLERHLARGVRRALEVLAPSPLLTAPDPAPRKVSHGELRWIEGHRVALLQGTPEQVGRAHGELFREEIQRCTDSVLYCFGMVQSIRTGRWFPDELQAAHNRLAPFIPEDHRRETIALAQAADLDEQTVQNLNVFPEMFHCSGFAVSGPATTNGKLYHGRVLDYMTTIGLQHSAVTFVIAIDEKIPFINVGYAGFIGSVSGMNLQQISLGEMGGRGEGHWDGVPMATLMRRGLEECHSLSDVKELWQTSPRTCEYYYVFADGKDNSACGVAATPEKLQFIATGETHPLLGDGIPNVVVLSSGERLATLRSRVQEYYGKIDAERAMWLMSRPVAMKSNLHNVLFVPADGVCYVAHADHKSPAAERPYVRLDLKELLADMAVPLASSGKVERR